MGLFPCIHLADTLVIAQGKVSNSMLFEVHDFTAAEPNGTTIILGKCCMQIS